MDEQSQEALRKLLQQLAATTGLDTERCVQGRVGLDGDGNIIMEVHIDDHCIAFMIDILDNDTYSINFAGGYRNGERFELYDDPIIIKDEVDALVQIPAAVITVIPELARDEEGFKAAIHDHWLEPEVARFRVDAMRIISSLGDDTDG
jgi:hypothetical protein